MTNKKSPEIFTILFFSDGEYLFAEPDSKLSKYAPKSWRSSHSHGLDANGRPALAFYYRVQFFVDTPLLLRDETTRHHYYLQLRHNTASGAAGDHATHLAGLSLQVLSLNYFIILFYGKSLLLKKFKCICGTKYFYLKLKELYYIEMQ